MKLKDFKRELKQYKNYDPWGHAMNAFFECAGRMNRRELPIPLEWGYRTGMGSDGTDKESQWYAVMGRCGDKQLSEIGAFLHRYTNLLVRHGKNY